MADSAIGVAVVGAGMAGRAHAAGYVGGARRPGSCRSRRWTWWRSPTSTRSSAPRPRRALRLRARRDELGGARGGSPDVDVVSVVVANHLHRKVVEGLLAAGKHVLCEKPNVAHDDRRRRGDGRRGAGGAGRRPTGGRFHVPAVAADLGHPRAGRAAAQASSRTLHFNGHYWCDYGVDPRGPMSWRYKGAPGSGALADIGSHLTDLAEFIGGPIAAVRGAVFTTVIPASAPCRWVPPSATPATASERPHLGTGRRPASARRSPPRSRPAPRAHFLGAGEAYGQTRQRWASRSSPAAGAATFDLEERAGEFRVADLPRRTCTALLTARYLAGPAHPYLTGGLAMDFPGIGFGQERPLRVAGARVPSSRSRALTGGLPRTARRSRTACATCGSWPPASPPSAANGDAGRSHSTRATQPGRRSKAPLH